MAQQGYSRPTLGLQNLTWMWVDRVQVHQTPVSMYNHTFNLNISTGMVDIQNSVNVGIYVHDTTADDTNQMRGREGGRGYRQAPADPYKYH